MSVKKKWIISLGFVLLSMIIAVVGNVLFGERRYYLTSLLIIILALLMLFLVFEKRKPKTREIVLIAVLCTLAVLGRLIFAPFPQFKPMVAIVILAGVAFGGEVGFFVGSMTAFSSNFLFGQGPWTPWQMIVLGIIGFISGGFSKKQPATWLLCVYGFVVTFVIYGLVMDVATGLLYLDSLEFVLASLAAGIVFNVIHGVSTVIFLALMTKPVLEKLCRLRRKYGLLA